MHLSIKLCN